MSERELVEKLGSLDVDDAVRVTTTDGTTFEGPADPIDYVPEESLRIEVRPENSDERYEIRGEYDGEWGEMRARGVEMAGEDTEWEDLGRVEHAEVSDDGDDWNWGVS